MKKTLCSLSAVAIMAASTVSFGLGTPLENDRSTCPGIFCIKSYTSKEMDKWWSSADLMVNSNTPKCKNLKDIILVNNLLVSGADREATDFVYAGNSCNVIRGSTRAKILKQLKHGKISMIEYANNSRNCVENGKCTDTFQTQTTYVITAQLFSIKEMRKRMIEEN